MVFTCTNCGAPRPVDNARLPKTAFLLRCGKCQNAMRIEPQPGGIFAVRSPASSPVAAPRREPASPPEKPLQPARPAEQGSTAPTAAAAATPAAATSAAATPAAATSATSAAAI